MVTKLVKYEVNGRLFETFEEAEAYENKAKLEDDLRVFLNAWKVSTESASTPDPSAVVNCLSTYWTFTLKEGV